IIGSGKGGQMAVFRNQQGKAFLRDTNALFAATVTRDQTAVLGWHRAAGKPAILTGAACYEDGNINLPGAQMYDLASGKLEPALPGDAASIGALALAGIDGGGCLARVAGS